MSIVRSGLSSPLHNLCQSKMLPDISIIALLIPLSPKLAVRHPNTSSESRQFVAVDLWTRAPGSFFVFSFFQTVFLTPRLNVRVRERDRGGRGANLAHLPTHFWGVAMMIPLHLMALRHIRSTNKPPLPHLHNLP